MAFHTNGQSWSNIYCPLGCPSEHWVLICIFPFHTRSWHFSNDVPLPAGSSLSSLAMTLTSKRTLHSLGIASLSQALLCNLQVKWEKIQETKIQSQSKGFYCPFIPLEIKITGTVVLAFHQSQDSFQHPNSCEVLNAELPWWGHSEGICLQPTARVCVCIWANVSKDGSNLLTCITSMGQKLLALGDTVYNTLTSFSHWKANFSLFSYRNTTRQVNMMSKKDCQQGCLRAYHALAVPLSSLPMGREAYRFPHLTQSLSFINTVCSHKTGKIILRWYKRVWGGSYLTCSVIYSLFKYFMSFS